SEHADRDLAAVGGHHALELLHGSVSRQEGSPCAVDAPRGAGRGGACNPNDRVRVAPARTPARLRAALLPPLVRRGRPPATFPFIGGCRHVTSIPRARPPADGRGRLPHPALAGPGAAPGPDP